MVSDRTAIRKRLAPDFCSSAGQSGAAIALHPLVDPGNFFEALGALTFASDKKKVCEAVGIK